MIPPRLVPRRKWAKKQDSKGDTYNGNFAAKVILDLPRFDGIGGIFCYDLVQFWNLAINLKVLGTIEKETSSRLIPIFSRFTHRARLKNTFLFPFSSDNPDCLVGQRNPEMTR